jgi:gamma-glutamyl hydrolase
VLTRTFNASKALSDYFTLAGVSHNPEGVEFVSVIQGKTWPVVGLQFHPEKNNFEYWADANRSRQGISASQHLANQFVDKARLSTHSFDSLEDLEASLIYHTKTFVPASGISQIYIFQENRSIDIHYP